MAEQKENRQKRSKKPGKRSQHYLLLHQLLKLMNGRFNYENGLGLIDIAKAIYGSDDLVARQRARALVSRARKFLRAYGLDLYGVLGNSGYRYYILAKPEDYKKVMEQLKTKIEALKSTQMYLLDRSLEAEDTESWEENFNKGITQVNSVIEKVEQELVSGHVEKAIELLANEYKRIAEEYQKLFNAYKAMAKIALARADKEVESMISTKNPPTTNTTNTTPTTPSRTEVPTENKEEQTETKTTEEENRENKIEESREKRTDEKRAYKQ